MITMICPFCQSKVERLNEICNGFCKCGAKYYSHDKVWLNRKTGEEIHENDHSLITVQPVQKYGVCNVCHATAELTPGHIKTKIFKVTIGDSSMSLCLECMERLRLVMQDTERIHNGKT